MPRVLLIVAVSLVLCGFAIGQTGHPQTSNKDVSEKTFMAPCNDCHVCDKPTTENPCLQRCPRHDFEMVAKHSPDEGPDVLIINDIENQYHPVIFSHSAHAHMSEFGTGCMECHHYTPPGEIPPCIECHSVEGVNPNNLRQPGLKGAYHRQCLKCHRDWSHDTACEFCHARKRPEEIGTKIKVTQEDIKKAKRPLISLPERKVYKTKMEDGPYVTFFHEQHARLYGLSCEDCHIHQDCGTCHTPPTERPPGQKTFSEHHEPCFECHGDAPCQQCHLKKETEGFTHAKTGWPLNRFHNKLSCDSCHPKGQRIARLNTGCTSCHRDWTTENFNHGQIVGVVLGDIHKELECSACHLDNRFDKKPTCNECHEGYVYPEMEPKL
jgi:hypothetical protein